MGRLRMCPPVLPPEPASTPTHLPWVSCCPAGGRVCFLAEVNAVVMDELCFEVRLGWLPSRY